MSREKQIEEMAESLRFGECIDVGITECRKFDDCDVCKATRLYNAGYRKQEWISVEERLPEREGYYLTSTIKGVITIGAFFSYYGSSYNPQFKYDVTHWMPLPEALKMKGDKNG